MKPPRALILLKPTPTYRLDAFRAGLERLGFRLSPGSLPEPQPGDVLVLWNRPRAYEATAARFESGGAKVVIAENGYLPEPEPKTFALALSRHNGAGQWWPEGRPRFPVPLAPWRTEGRDTLILAQRGIGQIGIAQPHGWPERLAAQLRSQGLRVRVRPHPAGRPAAAPLGQDLESVMHAFTWGSASGLRAIQAGIPCYYGLGPWIGAQAAGRVQDFDPAKPAMGDREAMFARLTWAQWTPDEIASGEALAHLLRR